MLPNPLEEIARKLDEYNKRLSHLERLEEVHAPTYLTAGAFTNVSFGNEVLTDYLVNAVQMPVWAFDSGATEAAIANMPLPAGVSDIDSIDYYWAMASAIGGNVVLDLRFSAMAEDEAPAAASTEQVQTTVAVPDTTGKFTKTNITFSTLVVVADDLLAIRAGRSGGDGNDTASGDLYLIGIRINWR